MKTLADVRSSLASDARADYDRLAHQLASALTRSGTAISLESLGDAISKAMPSLTAAETEGLAVYSAFVLVDGSKSRSTSAAADLAEFSALDQQMMKVQMAMQRENVVFTSVSNVLKTRHDTAKNSIANIR